MKFCWWLVFRRRRLILNLLLKSAKSCWIAIADWTIKSAIWKVIYSNRMISLLNWSTSLISKRISCMHIPIMKLKLGRNQRMILHHLRDWDHRIPTWLFKMRMAPSQNVENSPLQMLSISKRKSNISKKTTKNYRKKLQRYAIMV